MVGGICTGEKVSHIDEAELGPLGGTTISRGKKNSLAGKQGWKIAAS